MENTATKYGYCHLIIEPLMTQKIILSNGERAFVVAQLQDLLSPRLILGDVPAHRQLASCIDLLAFSITPKAIHLLVFTIDFTIAKDFAHRLAGRLTQYQSELRLGESSYMPEVRIIAKKLSGPHQALSQSIKIHLLHEDWEYDRYSSIGFYLHDRRGDWMRIWRLTNIYETEPELYYELVKSYLPPTLRTEFPAPTIPMPLSRLAS